MVDDVSRLRAVIAREIPLSGALGVTVESFTNEGLTLVMPAGPNRNDKGTVFAGSLGALATLTGWSFLWLVLREEQRPATIVLQDCSIRFLHPLAMACQARCSWPAAGALSRLTETLRRGRPSRITLEVGLWGGPKQVGSFTGRYVAQPTRGQEGAA
jgi:thioesterase domain-containing protein